MAYSDINTEEIASRIPVLRIITIALMTGVIVFTSIAYVVAPTDPNEQQGQEILKIMAPSMFGICFILWFVIPGLIVKNQTQAIANGTWQPAQGNQTQTTFSETGKYLAVYQTKHIIGLALLEGPAFFCAIVFLLTRDYYMLIPIVVVLLIMAGSFPSRDRVHQWIEMQLRRQRELA